MAADEARVPAGPLIQAWNQLALENERVASYYEAADFWGTVGQLMTARRDKYQQHVTDLEASGWQSEAATALTDRARRGIASVDAWLAADLPGTANKFRVAADTIGPKYQAVNEIRDLLSGTSSGVGQAFSQAWDRFLASGGGELPTFRMEGEEVVVTPAGHAPTVQRKIEEAAQHARDVDAALEPVRTSMQTWQNHLWDGPLRGMAPGGPARNTPGAPPGGPGGAPPGGPGGAPSGGPGGAPSGGPGGAPPGGPGGAPPGGPGGAPPGGAPPGGPGGEPPGGAPPGGAPPGGTEATAPGGPGSTPDLPGSDLPGAPDLAAPPTDPSLAGLPTATVPPPSTSVPPPSLTDFTPTPSSLGPGSGPTGSTPSSFTPFSSPVTGGPTRNAEQPHGANPRNTTVNGPQGTVPGGGQAGPQPVPRNVVAGSGSGSGGPGFFPPMMPPMMPPGGGMGANQIKPGEADFAGGPPRQLGRRESWRAGLRSSLLGRTGEYDDDPPPPAAPPPAGGEVLDEELWRVADAAPVAPPEPQSRRGRSW